MNAPVPMRGNREYKQLRCSVFPYTHLSIPGCYVLEVQYANFGFVSFGGTLEAFR